MNDRKKIWISKLILIVSYCAVFSLTTAVRTHLLGDILRNLLIGIVLIILFPGKLSALSREKPNWWQITACALVSLAFFCRFRSNWLYFYKFSEYIERFGGWWPLIISAVALFGIAASLPLQWKLLGAGRHVIEKLDKAADSHEDAVGPVSMEWIRAALALLLVLMQFYIMQYSMLPFPRITFGMFGGYLVLNLVLILEVNLAFVLLLQRLRYAFLASTVFFALWGFANHYVFLLHGSPLFIAELANAKTALNVVSNYSISLDEIPWAVLAMAFYTFVFLGIFWKIDKQYGVYNWKIVTARIALAGVLLYPIYTNLLADDARTINGALPTYYVSHYGFVCVAAADAARSMDPITVPVGYSSEKLPEATPVEASVSRDYPDIILILNESFCDLDYYASMNADRDYMASFFNIDGAYYGNAVVPSLGGGTNNSEYELLTGFPYYLVNGYAPFNYLNFTKINSNCVQYLKRLGYYTAGMHFYSRENYHRSTAYPAMGFDDVVLGPPEGFDDQPYGHRDHLDASYYDLLEDYIDSYPEDMPRFVYLLTFQNHGGFDQNDPALDTVHTGANRGVDKNIVNEFLTSVSMSADAFKALTEHFAHSERKTIVCMAGDHAPDFIQQMDSDKNWPGNMIQVAKRVVPYVIWSNYDLDLSECRQELNLFALLPQLISAAGLPETEYFRSVNQMSLLYPVFLSTGFVVDAYGKTGTYDPADPSYDPITKTLYIAYNSLNHGEDFQEALYLPQ